MTEPAAPMEMPGTAGPETPPQSTPPARAKHLMGALSMTDSAAQSLAQLHEQVDVLQERKLP